MPPEPFLSRKEVVRHQAAELGKLLRSVRSANPFQAQKLAAISIPDAVEDLPAFLGAIPFTTKAELSADQLAHPPYGTNLTFAPERYTRCHQTSGTSGNPLRWLDTPETWQWMRDNWRTIYHAAGVCPADTVFFAFSFGPFLGFWLAFEAALEMGCRCLPGGGMSTAARVHAILDHGATALCCTPTYAQHLAEAAAAEGISLKHSPVRKLIVAGEPGGCIAATRARLEALWPGARVHDHHGMTEVGPVTYECPARPRVLHVMERAYIAEVIEPATGLKAPAGESGELILTTLGRTGSPLIRYRTGDLVRTSTATICACGSPEIALEGGILGRTDDMVCVRGVNVYPGAIEEILRAHLDVTEYQVNVSRSGAMAELTLLVEPSAGAANAATLADDLQRALQVALNLRIPVTTAAPGSLPRQEMKARRWIVH